MDAAEILKLLLTSPVVVASVPTVLAVLAGRHLIEARDQRIASLQEAHAEAIRAKDAEIETLQRLSPVRLREDAEAVVTLMQMKSRELEEQLKRVQSELDELHRLRAEERRELDMMSRARRSQVEAIDGLIRATNQAASTSLLAAQEWQSLLRELSGNRREVAGNEDTKTV